MRVREVFVDPDPTREVLVGQFARREHDLTVLAVDHVPVVVHVHEIVVGPDLLELPVGGEQGPVVPEPHVFDRQVVADKVGRSQLPLGGEHLLLDVGQAIGQPREADILRDVRPFHHALVRHNLEAVHKLGVERETDRRDRERQATEQDGRAPDRLEGEEQAGQRGERAEHDECL